MAKAFKASRLLSILTAVVISYLVTIFLLLVLAFIVLKKGTYGVIVGVVLTAIYIIAPFIGGIYIGKRMNQKKFLWGMLTAFVYFIIYVFTASVTGAIDEKSFLDFAKSFVLIMAGGTIGGMLS